MDAFPQLKDAGGYELLRVSEDDRRTLETIPAPPYGYSVEYLKECVHQAKIYIRPIQKNLSEDILLPLVVRLLLFLLYIYIIIIMQQENFVCMEGVEKKYVCNL